ncbi:BshB3 potential contributor to bacillithiol synthesis [Halalkalibacter alkalisediminis]|uniref:BshB3 potential contributor to bacillithiol synthesis n=1 Tax=Halalkalibacter alkalisediminis TaxID=935616 RepID=A0ABV6NP31_9BACI|nr:BshB3 potential contributor to bacillithiol synthesis [Halalkalibacter alkalisediminis]
MNFMIVLAIVVCMVALVVTLMLTQAVDPDYEKNKNIAKLSFIYIALIPLVAVVIALIWIFI